MISRRELLASGAFLAAGLPPAPMPMRPLGRTGVHLPILAFGTAPVGERCSLAEGVDLLERALEAGITYFDTAPNTGGYGQAQLQLGAALAGRRTSAFLVTKAWQARADDLLRSLEASLKELRTDHVDLLLAHSIGTARMPPAQLLARGGAVEGLRRARQMGLTRFIGFSSHNRPARCLELLDHARLDAIMTAANMVDTHTYGFERTVWPVAASKGVGVIGMKIFGGQWGVAKSSAHMPAAYRHLALRYQLSRPEVTCAVVGMATREELETNLEWARTFAPLSPAEKREVASVGRQLAAKWKQHLGVVR